MPNYLKILLLSALCLKVFCQQDIIKPVVSNNKDSCLSGHEGDIWYMGRNGIDWGADTPRVITGFNTSSWGLNYQEAYTSICDRNGKLLLYSDNKGVFNKSHQLITLIQGSNNTTMMLILPLPGNDSIYYIFHSECSSPYDYTNDLSAHSLLYTIINIRGNNNAGSVVKKNQMLLAGTSEKITGVKHCNGHDWWIIGLRSEDEAFYSWLLDDIGLHTNSPVISFSGRTHINNVNSIYQNKGYLKPSHNGALLAEITYGDDKPNYLELHKFDPATGLVFAGIEVLGGLEKLTLYACEFSPDNSKLYLPAYNHYIKSMITGMGVYQLDVGLLDSSYVRNTLTKIFNGRGINFGSPVLGKDKKIYITTWNNSNRLHVIHNPDGKGFDCNFKGFDFDLGINSALGVPLFPSGLQFPNRIYIQGPDIFCADTIVEFILSEPCSHPATKWNLLDGGKMMNHNGDTIQVNFPDKGTFRIAASYPTPCGQKTDTLKVQVTPCNCYPNISWIRMDTVVCEGQNAEFKFASNSTEILLNNTTLHSDTFSLSNLKRDTSIQLMIKYPRSCDSIINIDIEVHQKNNSDIKMSICKGDSVLIFGKWRNIPGSYSQDYISSVGCDSIVTLNLTIGGSSDTIIQKTACKKFGFNDKVYTEGGKYYIKLKNHQGCDSTIELNLSIVALDTNVTKLQNTLIALDSAANYKWVDCNNNYSIIPGATQKTLTPIKDGYYAVILNNPPCIDTSACVEVVLTQTINSSLNNFIIYPNPAKDELIIESNLELPYNIKIESLSGSSIHEIKNVHTDKMIIPVENYPVGLYIISIQNSKKKNSQKWLKI